MWRHNHSQISKDRHSMQECTSQWPTSDSERRGQTSVSQTIAIVPGSVIGE